MGAWILGEPGEWMVDGGTKEEEVSTTGVAAHRSRISIANLPFLDYLSLISAGNARVVRSCVNSSTT